jgi:UDP-N-acetylglucosamine 2-epimerase (non-hydrolysing)
MAIVREADLLFAPTDLSAANLAREGLHGRVYVTGNSGIDPLRSLASRRVERQLGDPPRLLVTCHRRENWGESLDSVAAALTIIASEKIGLVEIVLHPNPVLAERIRALLPELTGIRFSPPLGHEEMIAAMLEADLVLSDSGGMQEEAAALGVPLLVLRARTERPEAIACGGIELVGTDPNRIVSAVRRRLKSPRPNSASAPFGDGRAGERIAAIIEMWLAERGFLSPISSAASQTAG